VGSYRLTHYDGTINATTLNVPLILGGNKAVHGVWLSNQEAATALQISFDGGCHFFTVLANTMVFFDNILAHSVVLKSTKSSHAYSLLSKEG
jgi:hypothetical protein